MPARCSPGARLTPRRALGETHRSAVSVCWQGVRPASDCETSAGPSPALRELGAGSGVLGERCGEPTFSLSAEARRSTPVNEKEKGQYDTPRAIPQAREHKHPVSKGYGVLCTARAQCTSARCMSAQARVHGGLWLRAGGWDALGSPAFSCPPAQPCRKLEVFE